ncbi:hypothetical protein FHG87_018118 [Trinorchestia longiramus]|nr:hypothetical protein FHG87_018118 [Trinorchestia longiramus]
MLWLPTLIAARKHRAGKSRLPGTTTAINVDSCDTKTKIKPNAELLLQGAFSCCSDNDVVAKQMLSLS